MSLHVFGDYVSLRFFVTFKCNCSFTTYFFLFLSHIFPFIYLLKIIKQLSPASYSSFDLDIRSEFYSFYDCFSMVDTGNIFSICLFITSFQISKNIHCPSFYAKQKIRYYRIFCAANLFLRIFFYL